jgi:phosphoenolpyruvate synthase/pyruvate phosphate dikinase
MIEFTDEMHEAIDNALANGTPCIVGTASAGGDPNLGFKGSVMALDGSRLAYWERSMRTILEHIEENPKVVVMYRDPARRLAWRLYGDVTVHRDGSVRDEVMARVVQPELDRDPERQGFAVVIDVERITTLGADVVQER